MVESLITQTKIILMMDIGSPSKIGHNVHSIVEEEHKLYKDNVYHPKAMMENLVMEILFRIDHAIHKIVPKMMPKLIKLMTKPRMSLCKLDNFLQDSKELRDVFWLRETWI